MVWNTDKDTYTLLFLLNINVSKYPNIKPTNVNAIELRTNVTDTGFLIIKTAVPTNPTTIPLPIVRRLHFIIPQEAIAEIETTLASAKTMNVVSTILLSQKETMKLSKSSAAVA